jgi:hypothetical protein
MSSLHLPAAFLLINGGTLLWWRSIRAALLCAPFAVLPAFYLYHLRHSPYAPTFFYTPSAAGVTWAPPADCATVQATLLGGGGGAGYYGLGGPGAQVTFYVNVRGASQPLTAYVGGGGVGGDSKTKWGQGGFTCAGAGGAASALTFAGSLMAIAGGGGGGGTNGSSGGSFTSCTGGAGGTPNGGTPACTGPGGGATQSAIGVAGSPTAFTSGAIAAGPALTPVAQSGGDGSAGNLSSRGVPPLFSVKSIGFAPGGWGGCFNPPTSFGTYRGGGGGGGGYFGGGGGKTDRDVAYVGSPGGGGSSWVSATPFNVSYLIGAAGGAGTGGNGADGSVMLQCVTRTPPWPPSATAAALVVGLWYGASTLLKAAAASSFAPQRGRAGGPLFSLSLLCSRALLQHAAAQLALGACAWALLSFFCALGEIGAAKVRLAGGVGVLLSAWRWHGGGGSGGGALQLLGAPAAWGAPHAPGARCGWGRGGGAAPATLVAASRAWRSARAGLREATSLIAHAWLAGAFLLLLEKRAGGVGTSGERALAALHMLGAAAQHLLLGAALAGVGHGAGAALLTHALGERVPLELLLEGVGGSPLAPAEKLRAAGQCPLAYVVAAPGVAEAVVAAGGGGGSTQCEIRRAELFFVALRIVPPRSLRHYLVAFPADAAMEAAAGGGGGGPLERGGAAAAALSFTPPPWQPPGAVVEVAALNADPTRPGYAWAALPAPSAAGTPAAPLLIPAATPFPHWEQSLRPFTAGRERDGAYLAAWQRRLLCGEWALWGEEAGVAGSGGVREDGSGARARRAGEGPPTLTQPFRLLQCMLRGGGGGGGRHRDGSALLRGALGEPWVVLEESSSVGIGGGGGGPGGGVAAGGVGGGALGGAPRAAAAAAPAAAPAGRHFRLRADVAAGNAGAPLALPGDALPASAAPPLGGYLPAFATLSPWAALLRDLVLCGSAPGAVSGAGWEGGGYAASVGDFVLSRSGEAPGEEGSSAPPAVRGEGDRPIRAAGAHALGGRPLLPGEVNRLFADVTGRTWRHFMWAATALIDEATVLLLASAATGAALPGGARLPTRVVAAPPPQRGAEEDAQPAGPPSAPPTSMLSPFRAQNGPTAATAAAAVPVASAPFSSLLWYALGSPLVAVCGGCSRGASRAAGRLCRALRGSAGGRACARAGGALRPHAEAVQWDALREGAGAPAPPPLAARLLLEELLGAVPTGGVDAAALAAQLRLLLAPRRGGGGPGPAAASRGAMTVGAADEGIGGRASPFSSVGLRARRHSGAALGAPAAAAPATPPAGGDGAAPTPPRAPAPLLRRAARAAAAVAGVCSAAAGALGAELIAAVPLSTLAGAAAAAADALWLAARACADVFGCARGGGGVAARAPTHLEAALLRSPAESSAELLGDLRSLVAAADLLASVTAAGARGEDRMGLSKHGTPVVVYSLAAAAAACGALGASPRYGTALGVGEAHLAPEGPWGSGARGGGGREEENAAVALDAALRAAAEEAALAGAGADPAAAAERAARRHPVPLIRVSLALPLCKPEGGNIEGLVPGHYRPPLAVLQTGACASTRQVSPPLFFLCAPPPSPPLAPAHANAPCGQRSWRACGTCSAHKSPTTRASWLKKRHPWRCKRPSWRRFREKRGEGGGNNNF